MSTREDLMDMGRKTLLDWEFAKYAPIIDKVSKNTRNQTGMIDEMKEDDYSILYNNREGAEVFSITNSERRFGEVLEGPEIRITLGQNEDRAIEYKLHNGRNSEIMLAKISQDNDEVHYWGMREDLESNGIRSCEKYATQSVMDGINQDISYFRGIEELVDTVDMLEQGYGKLQELVGALGIDKEPVSEKDEDLKRKRLQNLLESKLNLTKNVAISTVVAFWAWAVLLICY